ncbi:MAG: GNAT family N-acetyltransferase [Planctomycetes bacterium]|nr:GNAT family N-acetyltransferase [Planctomycetota bacterium]
MSKLGSLPIIRDLASFFRRHVFRKIVLDILRRPLSLPNAPIPRGRLSAMNGEEGGDVEFKMDECTHEMVELLAKTFPSEKVPYFHEMVDESDVDFVVRMREDGECWGYMMNSRKPFRDRLFGFKVPIEPNEVFQFDGWVHPDYRGRLIAILGQNWVFDQRRAEGFEATVVTVRRQDKSARRYHDRYGFDPIGVVTHWRIGPFKINRVKMNRPDPEASPANTDALA